MNIRNIAIIAHVDHGKTTLVDKMMMAGNLFRENQAKGELMLDNNDLERERGITILSKNVSIIYKDTKINIIDTPGHSDFGGEVERVLNMADGCILLVDAFEGPMPQTRFVLQKALQIGLKPIVVVNKVDKPNCRPEEVYEMVFDLMFALDATEDQLDFPVLYGSAKQGWMSTDWQKPTDNIYALLDAIIEHIPAPRKLEGNLQMLVTSLDYSSYTGRIAVGRINRGRLDEGMMCNLAHRDGSIEKVKIKELHTFVGMGRKRVDSVDAGDSADGVLRMAWKILGVSDPDQFLDFSKCVNLCSVAEEEKLIDKTVGWIDSEAPVLLKVGCSDKGDRWLVVVGYAVDENARPTDFLVLDPQGHSPICCMWNGILNLDKMPNKKYGYSYSSDWKCLVNLDRAVGFEPVSDKEKNEAKKETQEQP